jgi:hypothetical protein
MSLGVVLTPFGHIPGSFPAGTTYSSKGATSWAQPFDPQFYTRGQAGFYYDTPLGGLRGSPTDFELASRAGYLPVMSGWTVTNNGHQPGNWLPPDGGYPGQPAATRYPLVPRGLGDGTPATADDVLAVMAAHNDRVFALTLVSTAAVAVSAMITIFRTLKLIKGGKHD